MEKTTVFESIKTFALVTPVAIIQDTAVVFEGILAGIIKNDDIRNLDVKYCQVKNNEIYITIKNSESGKEKNDV